MFAGRRTDMTRESGSVVFLNGTSSSGKSTIAKELQKSLDEPYMHVSVDGFLHQLPDAYLTDNKYLSDALPILLAGFNASNAAIARAGNNMIIDHVLQEPSWVAPCVKAFDGLEVVFVGVHCSLDVLEAREKSRGDRQVGMARYQYDRVHSHNTYDVEVDTSEMTVEQCVSVIREYVHSDMRPIAFDKLRAANVCEQDAPADADKPHR
jgi:chloramphenicol 3-O phosphotransferase